MQQLTELQEKWLKALESGEYKQTSGYLSKDGGYCCLGVAAVCAGMGFSAPDIRGVQSLIGNDAQLWERSLPFDLTELLRLRDPYGEAVRGDSLTNRNDAGETFSQIAATVRANPENFFLPPEAV